MISQQYVDRISVRIKRFPDLFQLLSPAENLLRSAVVVMITLVFAFGLARAVGSSSNVKPSTVKVTVKQGDTLWGYATKYGNRDRYILSRVDEIAKLNNLSRSKAIEPGTQLIIPK